MRRAILVTVSLLLAAAEARAEDYDQAAKDLARRYAEEGITRYDSGDYAAAVQSFTKAYRVLGAPTVALRLARAQVKLGHLVEASKVYEAVATTPIKKGDPPVYSQAIAEATTELGELTPRIPTLKLTLAADVTSPTLDGKPFPPEMLGKPIPINPGDHRLAGDGAAPEALLIRERERIILELHASTGEPAAQPAASGRAINWRRLAGISGAGLAGVALIVGVAESIKARSLSNDGFFDYYRRQHPAEDVCVVAESDFSVAGRQAQASCHAGTKAFGLQLIFYPAAVLLGGASAYLLVTHDKPASPPASQVLLFPRLGPSNVGIDITGTF